MTPLLAMYSLGHAFIPPAIHAGGLRYHGMSPLVSAGVRSGLFSPTAYPQLECYEAAVTFARTEGLIPAPETSHAIAGAINEAKKATEEGKEKTILFNYSGHGLLDLAGYQAYFADELQNYPLPPEVMERSLAVMEGLPKPE
jgi:tryptophan synthase beta chain